MKISTFLATSLGVFLLAGAANAATVTYTATLTGPQADNVSTATATATLDFDTDTKKLTGPIVYEGFTIKPSQAHIHSGACNETGSSFKSVEPDGTAGTAAGSFDVDVTLDTDQEAALGTGALFATISNDTFAFPLYEVRGQILATGATNNLCSTLDAGTDSGTDSGSGSGTGTDAGTDTMPNTTSTTTTDSSSGCNTTGSSSSGSSAALALGLGLALYGLSRKRKQA